MEAAIPYDTTGNYSLPPSYFAQAGQTIRTEQHNPPFEDIAQALGNVLLRDGRGGMTANLNMGSFKAINLAPGTNPTDAATVSQASVPIGTLVDWAGDTAPAGWFLCYGQAISRTNYPQLFAICGTKYGVGNGSSTFNLPDCRGRLVAGKDNMGGADAGRLSGSFGALARTLGGAFGSAVHMLTLAQIPSHNHGGVIGGGAHAHSASASTDNHSHTGSTSTDPGHAHTVPVATSSDGSGASTLDGGANAAVATSVAGAHAHSLSISGYAHTHAITLGGAGEHSHAIPAQGSGESHSNTQPTIIMNKIIKATL